MESTPYDTEDSSWPAAFRSVKAGKNVFMLIAAATILFQLVCFILIDFVGVIDAVEARGPGVDKQATTQEVRRDAEEVAEQAQSATVWQAMFHWFLPGTKFLGFVAVLLTVVTLMFAVKLALVGRLGGIAGFMSAFFWSLILLVVLTPWQQVLGGAVASGALYNLGELTRQVRLVNGSWGASDANLMDWTLYYARFIAYPVIALLVWALVMLKFARGFKQSSLAPVGTVLQTRLAEPASPPAEGENP